MEFAHRRHESNKDHSMTFFKKKLVIKKYELLESLLIQDQLQKNKFPQNATKKIHI